jgi:hypothetical protein
MMLNNFRKVIPLWCAISLIATTSAASAAENWSDKPTTLTVKEYFELILACKLFRNSNPTEPASVHFVPNQAPEKALLFVIRSVVTPDFDLTDKSEEKAMIVKDFRNNVSKQADSLLSSCRKLLADPSVSSRWSNASVENNVAIRFVRSDNEKETVAITVNGQTTFDPREIASRSGGIQARAGDLWVK